VAAKSSRPGSQRGRRAPRDGPPRPKAEAFDAGIQLLARRPYGGAELGRRLLRLGYEEDDIKPALDALVQLGYIDDSTFAALHVARRAGKRGPRALAAELAAKGVDREIVKAAVGGFDRDTQVRMAARLVRRNVGSKLPPTYKELLAKQGARLLRRGYSHSIALAACHAVWTGTEDLLVGA
jgi:regulatory protein